MQKETERKYLTTRELARMLDVAPGTLHNHRTAGTGPNVVRLGGLRRYRMKDLMRFVALCAGDDTPAADRRVGTC